MPSLPVIKTLLRELCTREHSRRIPEPDLVMDDPEKVMAYTRAGREDGVMASVYLFHCAQVCEVIRPGDKAVDLACGPATQLAMVARLNADVDFVGVDLSDEMLQRAQTHINDFGLKNVKLRKSDIADLGWLKQHSVDSVFSTMALHHLPSVDDLEKTFAEVKRVLKPGGGLYMVDFGRLKAEKSIKYFAYQYKDRQPELFTLDYLYSLRAAFSLSDYKKAWANHLKENARLHWTFLMPFMVAIKSPVRRVRGVDPIRQALRNLRDGLPAYHETDLNDLISFFRLGGLYSRLL